MIEKLNDTNDILKLTKDVEIKDKINEIIDVVNMLLTLNDDLK